MNERHPSRARAKATLLVAASLAVALGLAELALRLVHPVDWGRPTRGVDPSAWSTLAHRPSSLPGLSYELTPNRTGSARLTREGINRAGLRGREPVDPKQSFRIAVLGDSFTYGLGVRAKETYPARLHRHRTVLPVGACGHERVFGNTNCSRRHHREADHSRVVALALRIVEQTADYLATALVSLVHTVDPAGAILGGAMDFGGNATPLGRQFVGRVREQFRKRTFPVLAKEVAIDFASLGADAGYLGAAGLARAEYHAQP